MEKAKYIVIACAVALFFSLSSVAHAASLYATGSNSSIQVGQTYTATVYVNSGGVNINSAEGSIAVPTDLFDVQSISTTGSVFSMWVEQPVFSNGVITFSGGVPNPGFFGSAGKVLSVVLKAKQTGAGSLSFQSTAVRANDGLGSNVSTTPAGQTGAAVTIVPSAPVNTVPAPASVAPPTPRISSAQTPDQNAWYDVSESTFAWSIPAGVNAVQLLLGRNPNSDPTIVYSPAIAQKKLEDLPEGALYLHARFRNSAGWGPTTHFKFQIDRTAPEILVVTPEISSDDSVSLSLSASDELSGISKYTIAFDGQTPVDYKDIEKDGSARYAFINPPTGLQKVSVRAYDNAGNFKEEIVSITFPSVSAPTITEYPETINKDERFTIRGTAPAYVEVRIYIKEDGLEPTEFTTTARADGTFSFESDHIRTEGLVAVWAQSVKKDGALSVASEKVYIAVDQPLFVKYGKKLTDILAVSIPSLALILIGIVIFYLAFYRIRNIKKRLKTDLDGMESEVHNIMGILIDDMQDHVDMLEDVKLNRRLTREEARILKSFATNIKAAEKYLALKIKKIEKEDL